MERTFRYECRGCNDNLPCVLLIENYPGDDCSPPKLCPYKYPEKDCNWQPAEPEQAEPQKGVADERK